MKKNLVIVQEQIMQVIGQLKLIEKESEKSYEWQSNIALFTINAYINPIRANIRKTKKL